MKKQIKRILAGVVVGAAVLAVVGCGKQKQEQPKLETSVWSTYNTTKVIQQTGRNEAYQKQDGALSVQMMQNEYEGAQLIVTAGEDITYNLIAGALQNENGDVFPGENIQIYHQKYQTIKTNYNGDEAFQAGDSIPDMLLPLDIAVNYGENTISANQNQGITVEFHSKDVPAGVYTGSFTLELNGEKIEIPVSVEVWDIRYEGRRQFQSCFMIYRDELIVGEYSNSDEVVAAYIEKLLEYKANPFVVRTYYTPESFAREAQWIFESENGNSLALPVDLHLDYQVYVDGTVSEPAQMVVDYIRALVDISSEELNYVQYLYFYPSSYDEADVVEGRWDPATELYREDGKLQKTLELAIQQLEEDGWFARQTPEFAQQMKDAILTIPVVFTNVNFVEEWVGELNATFCPYLSLYNNTSVLNQYQDAAMDHSNGDLWAYTCSGPVDPYPTFHIDDKILDMRVCGWMEKAHGITGYLYYKVNNYAYLTNAPSDEYIDLYGTPARYYEVNGDGFLFYPGRYYGSDEPFGTVRLAAYRDGMDEYDMLCVYERLLQEYAQEQGITDFDFNTYVDDLYSTLFTGVVAKQSDEALYAARAELAQRILTLKNQGTLRYDPADGETVQISALPEGQEAVVIRSEYKDKDENVGAKTKMFRPSYKVKVSSMDGAKTLRFTYENTGTEDITMQIVLVTKDMEKVTVDTSYCGVGKTRQVKVNLSDAEVDLADVTEICLTFDNVQTNDAGQVVLLPDKAFTVYDFFITK